MFDRALSNKPNLETIESWNCEGLVNTKHNIGCFQEITLTFWIDYVSFCCGVIVKLAYDNLL
jgi:hypothetical protein